MRNIAQRHKHDYEAGFTIVELIVAIGVFVVVVSIAVGTFVDVVQNQRRITALMATNNNAGGVLEQMAREVRTGYRFCEGADAGENPADACVVDADSLSFTNYQDNAVVYAFDAVNGAIMRSGGESDAFPLTAQEVEVTGISFFIRQFDQDGDSGNDVCNPWRITIAMGVRSKNEALASQEIKLETSVSSRVLPAEAPDAPLSIEGLCPL